MERSVLVFVVGAVAICVCFAAAIQALGQDQKGQVIVAWLFGLVIWTAVVAGISAWVCMMMIRAHERRHHARPTLPARRPRIDHTAMPPQKTKG